MKPGVQEIRQLCRQCQQVTLQRLLDSDIGQIQEGDQLGKDCIILQRDETTVDRCALCWLIFNSNTIEDVITTSGPVHTRTSSKIDCTRVALGSRKGYDGFPVNLKTLVFDEERTVSAELDTGIHLVGEDGMCHLRWCWVCLV